jgi:hypothetical protein
MPSPTVSLTMRCHSLSYPFKSYIRSLHSQTLVTLCASGVSSQHRFFDPCQQLAVATNSSLILKIRSTGPCVRAANARYAAPMAVVAALVAMVTHITDSARMSGAAAVIADWSRSVVDVLDNLSLWRGGAVPTRQTWQELRRGSRMHIGALLT